MGSRLKALYEKDHGRGAAEVTAQLQAQTASAATAAEATERRRMAQAVEAETVQARAAEAALELKHLGRQFYRTCFILSSRKSRICS